MASPLPPCARPDSTASGIRKNGSKIDARYSSGTPGPQSRTSTSPTSGAWRMPLRMMFSSALASSGSAASSQHISLCVRCTRLPAERASKSASFTNCSSSTDNSNGPPMPLPVRHPLARPLENLADQPVESRDFLFDALMFALHTPAPLPARQPEANGHPRQRRTQLVGDVAQQPALRRPAIRLKSCPNRPVSCRRETTAADPTVSTGPH